jgi:hypothetical protein
MTGPQRLAAERLAPEPPPWTLRGWPDPDVSDDVRRRNREALTDPELARRFRRQRPLSVGADYDEMVRVLGHVWDCPVDHTANVTGYCCPGCGRGRAEAGA